MPELPEVETVMRGLRPHLEGVRIDDLRLMRKDLRTPFPKNFVRDLKGARITALRRRAKYILMDTDRDSVLLVHLGMSGSFHTLDAGAPQITEEMKMAAARGIADVVGDDLSEDYIIPSVFDVRVGPLVAQAVAEAAVADGVVRNLS